MYTAWQIMVLYVENNKSTSIYAFTSYAKKKYSKNDVGFTLGRVFPTHEMRRKHPQHSRGNPNHIM
jgi:hypothetical protein